ncbi:MAG: hypothetical protein WDN25_00440 [Acetobacteraceae bacterium]
MSRYLAICAVGGLLAGCAATPTSTTTADGVPYGYAYHDGIHDNSVNQPSPQAVYNATHGTYLWPPIDRGRNG